jgi:hypothetical protein
MARPVLRKSLGEGGPTQYETGLRDALGARASARTGGEAFGAPFAKEPRASMAIGVESIHAALFLGTPEALDRMWALQIREGKDKGAWSWFHLDADPYEMPESTYYGAVLAAIAAKSSPAEYKNRASVKEQTALLNDYLDRERSSQPLHNRLLALTAGHKDKEAIEQAWKSQRPDGGWSIESLGPWKKSQKTESDCYATAVAAYALKEAGLSSDKRLKKALDWLKAHQNPETGAWPSESMNKQYDPASMMAKFMQDAATSYAVLALLN